MPVTQEQIAKLAGVSRGTVDRTLNNRGRVDPAVAERIRAIAAELGYRRNRAGSQLVRAKRPLRLGIIVQSAQTPFMQQLLREIEAIRPAMQEQGAELLVRTMEYVNTEKQLALIDELRQEGIDGLSLSPAESEHICDKIDELTAAGIPVVTFNSDMPGSRRLCYVGMDNYVSGRAGAGLMNVLLGGRGSVLMITGYLSNRSHQRRIDGFVSEILTAYPGISLLPLERCNDDDQVAYRLFCDALDNGTEIDGVFLTANGPTGVCTALRERGLEDRIRVVAYDMTDANVASTRSGLIDFLIDQNPHAQAVRPLEVLIEYILTGTPPSEEYMLTQIDIRNRYNI